MRVLVVGRGAVGRAFAAAWQEAQLDVVQQPGRASWHPGEIGTPPDAALLAVPDHAIADVAQALVAARVAGPKTVLLHAAGALAPAHVFAPVRSQIGGVGLCHPLRALVLREGAPSSLADALFAVAGDPRGCEVAQELARLARGRPVVVHEAGLARYHAAAALVANHTLALVAAAVELLCGEGFARVDAERALGELLGSAAENVVRLGLPAALTGPMARGDADVVAHHLGALPPSARQLYLATAQDTLALARGKGAAQHEGLQRIERLLGQATTAAIIATAD